MLCHEPEPITFDAGNLGTTYIEQSCGAFSNGFQHRLKFGW
jgi:hypothetical protein